LLLGAAEVLREESDSIMTDYERPEYERELNALRSPMEEREFSRLWEEGRHLSMEEAIEIAVSDG
jgi:hypothetical protein